MLGYGWETENVLSESKGGGLSSNSNGPILIKLSEKPIYIPYNNRTEGFLQENSHVRDIDLEPRFLMHFSMIFAPARMIYCNDLSRGFHLKMKTIAKKM